MNRFLFYSQELQYRCCYILLSFVFCFLTACLEIQSVLHIFVKPLENTPILITDLTEFWYTMVFLSAHVALFLIYPFILYNSWLFLTPTLYKNEYRIFSICITLSIYLYLMSFCLTTLFTIPFIINFFFLMYAKSPFLEIQCLPKLFPYIVTLSKFFFFSFFIFQIPSVILILLELNCISSKLLITSRKLIIITSLFVSAFLSPPEIISQFLLTSLFLLFYECIIFFTLWFLLLFNKKSFQ
jgi:sec-independent protein translocase protein TatC